MKSQRGFTLIELMIVIAIIAILATLGVTNFSSALRRARDSKRESDIVAIQKALETCNNISQGIYIPGGAVDWNSIVTYQNSEGCYNSATLEPAIPVKYGYYGIVDSTVPQRFGLCAELENWDGNYSVNGAAGMTSTDKYNLVGGSGGAIVGWLTTAIRNVGSGSITPCNPSTGAKCEMFCVFSSQ